MTAPDFQPRDTFAAMDSSTGPVVGRSFCEFLWAPFDSPLGKDIPYDPAMTASPGAGLSEARDFRAFTKW
jgi:hypothetical protein